MKLKSLSLLAVTIAGIAMVSAACQAPSPQAKEDSGSPQTQNAEKPDNPPPSGLGSKGSMQGAALPPSLKLTDAQKTKMKEIQESYRSKMENILSDQQKNQLKAARDQGKGRTGMQSLNLTDAQKQQLKNLRQSQRQEIDSVLTNEQKQQLQEMRQKRQQKPNHGDMPAPQDN